MEVSSPLNISTADITPTIYQTAEQVVEQNNPLESRYLTVALLGNFGKTFYGKAGQTMIDLWAYMRAVDNFADDDDVHNPYKTKQQRALFVQDQLANIMGGNPQSLIEPEQSGLRELLNTMNRPELSESCAANLRYSTAEVVTTLLDDVAHLGWFPRTEEEYTDYSVRAVGGFIDIAAVLFNGTPVPRTPAFIEWLKWSNVLGALEGLGKDMAGGTFQGGLLPDEECHKIRAMKISDRPVYILDSITPAVFHRRLERATHKVFELTPKALMTLHGVPYIQRLAGTTYWMTNVHRIINAAVKYPTDAQIQQVLDNKHRFDSSS